LIATVLHDQAQPLADSTRTKRIAMLLGGEADGLDEQWIELCDQKIRIPMQLQTDSLNVATAAAIFLYHFKSIARTVG